MYTLFYFIVAHFIADFPLQPNRLADRKQVYFESILVHGMVHLIVSAILLFPFLGEPRVWLAMVVVFMSHVIIDQIKIWILHQFKPDTLMVYFYDQILHWLIIAFVTIHYIGPVKPQLSGVWIRYYTDSSILLYVTLVIVTTYFYDITRWIYRNARKKQVYKHDYSMMIRNFIIVTAAFVVYWITYP